jgi:hypothetical protein
VNTTPSGSRRTKRVKFSFGVTATSASACGAIAIMCRARSSVPRISLGA